MTLGRGGVLEPGALEAFDLAFDLTPVAAIDELLQGPWAPRATSNDGRVNALAFAVEYGGIAEAHSAS